MKLTLKRILFGLMILFTFSLSAQETLPIYSDYLSDNVYLVHPAAAGIGNCGKVRLTGRNQWSGVDDAPTLQTLSFHSRVGDKIGLGAIAYNDANGYHSQTGFGATFAYHIDLERPEDAHQLSFALSGFYVQNRLDQSTFPVGTDPVITGIAESSGYMNADFGMAYHNSGFFSYFTAKNLLLTARNLYDDQYEPFDLRRYLLTAGYYFGGNNNLVHLEPSAMFQLVGRTGEKFLDSNLKAYFNLDNAQLWAGLSYRQGFDGNEEEEFRSFSPILGVNVRQFMFSYTYTRQTGDFLFAGGSYHQITLGMNVFCRSRSKCLTACPNINGSF